MHRDDPEVALAAIANAHEAARGLRVDRSTLCRFFVREEIDRKETPFETE